MQRVVCHATSILRGAEVFGWLRIEARRVARQCRWAGLMYLPPGARDSGSLASRRFSVGGGTGHRRCVRTAVHNPLMSQSRVTPPQVSASQKLKGPASYFPSIEEKYGEPMQR